MQAMTPALCTKYRIVSLSWGRQEKASKLGHNWRLCAASRTWEKWVRLEGGLIGLKVMAGDRWSHESNSNFRDPVEVLESKPSIHGAARLVGRMFQKRKTSVQSDRPQSRPGDRTIRGSDDSVGDGCIASSCHTRFVS